MQLHIIAMFMSEHALCPEIAHACFVKGSTIVCFEFVAIHHDCHWGQLLLCVREPALVLESALGRLNPVAAELSLLRASDRSWHDRTLLLVQEGLCCYWHRVEIVFVGHTLSATMFLALQGAALKNICVLLLCKGRGNKLTGWLHLELRHSLGLHKV